MIKVSIMYPNQQGIRFDMAYYCARHIPMVRQLLRSALIEVAVEEGIAGMTPGSPAAFVAMGHLSFESMGAFQEAFTPHAPQIVCDIPNYTNSQPHDSISTVKI
jgi:uncharacterized protein (TIGR02118 family)